MRAVGEDDVVLGEALFGGGRRGDQEDTAGSEAEEENRAILGGDFGKGSVHWCFQKI